MLQVVNGGGLTAEGGSGSVALNFNNWLGTGGDFALYHSAVVGAGTGCGNIHLWAAFSYRRWGRITPFTQVLLGGVRYADNGFVFGSAGGADIALDHAGRFALRPRVEYFGFRADGTDYHTVRVCVGLVFRIGRG